MAERMQPRQEGTAARIMRRSAVNTVPNIVITGAAIGLFPAFALPIFAVSTVVEGVSTARIAYQEIRNKPAEKSNSSGTSRRRIALAA